MPTKSVALRPIVAGLEVPPFDDESCDMFTIAAKTVKASSVTRGTSFHLQQSWHLTILRSLDFRDVCGSQPVAFPERAKPNEEAHVECGYDCDTHLAPDRGLHSPHAC
jgi:hypothetical protein